MQESKAVHPLKIEVPINTNLEKYRRVFKDSLSIDENQLGEDLEYNKISAWDSIGHMTLISALEDAFGIMMEADDIIQFSSYKKGFEIVSKYGVKFN